MKFQISIEPTVFKISYDKAQLRDRIRVDIDISPRELYELQESPSHTIQGFGAELAKFMTYTMEKTRGTK